MEDQFLHSVLGNIPAEKLGMILPHEHIFTDLRGPQLPDYAWLDRGTDCDCPAVAEVILPLLNAAHNAGVTALVECSTVGVGRNIAILRYIAERTPIHIVAPTGLYREAFIPECLLDVSAEALSESWIKDLIDGIDGSDVKAGFIKIAMSDDGPTPREVRNLKAAARASYITGAAVASHTIYGSVALQEMDILEASGMDLRRFIWVHAHAESTHKDRLEAARRGAWIELDAIGAPWLASTETRGGPIVKMTLDLLEAGFSNQLLLSHDAGWFQPGYPGGIPSGGLRGYTALTEEFLPALQAHGVSTETIQQLVNKNPLRAFSF